MITQEDLDRISDKGIYVLENNGIINTFIASGGGLKSRQIDFLVCYVIKKFYISRLVDNNSSYCGIAITDTQDEIIRKPTMGEYLEFCAKMKENKIFYNKKTKEVKKL